MVDVAIVGMACVMPGAPDLETFWANIVDGIDSVTEVPPARWDPALHYDPDFDAAEMATARHPKTVSKWGGWIPDVEFDALAWGIPPASLASIDPVQLLALQMAAGALDDAGYGDAGGRDFDRDRASVVFASGSGGATDLPASFVLRSFLPHHLQDGIPDELDAFLPKLTEDAFPGILTSVIAGRVANRLDLGGKNLTVDAACASSLAAATSSCAVAPTCTTRCTTSSTSPRRTRSPDGAGVVRSTPVRTAPPWARASGAWSSSAARTPKPTAIASMPSCAPWPGRPTDAIWA